MSKQEYRIAFARFMSRAYPVVVTDEGRVIVDGKDGTDEIDAMYDPDAHYFAPTSN